MFLSASQIASDPAHSVWVSANAGSGKTKVLTDRVLRLLLSGTKPSKILCITYTNAATAEMKNRIYQQLSSWVALTDEALNASLKSLTGSPPTIKELSRARMLFASVIESPEGIRIQTIHALCQSLLRRFPVESEVPPHFMVIDEETSKSLLDEARQNLLKATANEHSPLASTLRFLSSRLHEQSFNDLLKTIIKERRKIQYLVQKPDGITKAIFRMRTAVMAAHAYPADISEEEVINDIAQVDASNHAILKSAISLLRTGSARDEKMADGLASWFELPAHQRKDEMDNYIALFLTTKDEPRKELINKVPREKYPHIEKALKDEQSRLVRLIAVLKSVRILQSSEHLLVLADTLLSLYDGLKSRTSSLDFEDQIQLALRLLQRDGIAPWILYKLDGGLDHILIDEAQDTSPMQWQLLTKLVEEFFAGDGAQKQGRTVFVVGDEKQSIFSFQGADPSAFDTMQRYFNQKHDAAEKPFIRQPLHISYRSTSALLSAVDAVFSSDEIQKGVILSDSDVKHIAHRTGEAGLVECWDLVEAPQAQTAASWQSISANQYSPSSQTLLAQRIATTIGSWLAEGRMLTAKNRLVRASDIMILVRSRGRMVKALLKALRRENIPVAGSDRLTLKEDIIVMDILALMKFLLLPSDDMNLAIVLKSPFIGLSEEDLFLLAYDRGKSSVWQRMKQMQAISPQIQAAYDWLTLALSKTDKVAPFELISLILESWDGRRRCIARIGPEVLDPLDEILSQALVFERDNPPSLQGFVEWMESRETIVKRDMEQSSDEVRILTVHGAKGLQSPIVFMPDTIRAEKNDTMPIYWSEQEDWLLWSPSAEDEDINCKTLKAQHKQRKDEEYRRLMYVAMTRAEDELYICGYKPETAIAQTSWYYRIREGLTSVAQSFEVENGALSWGGLRLESKQTKPLIEKDEEPHIVAPQVTIFPDFLTQPPKPEPVLPRPLSPSNIAMKHSPALSPSLDGKRILRGTIIHTLLQFLHQVAPELRLQKIAAYLAQQPLDTPEQADILSELKTLLESPLSTIIFSANGLSEVPISGVLAPENGTPVVVSGQIDRLVITDKQVLVIDYKTGKQVPKGNADIPLGYVRQMQLYRDLLRDIYPSKPIKCALLWTHAPKWFELTDDQMDKIAAQPTRASEAT